MNATMPAPYPTLPGDPPPVADRLRGVYVSRAGREFLTPTATPAEFLRALADADLYPDAFAVISFLLPTRMRVWWACLCIRGLGPADLDDVSRANFAAVVGWVRSPTEANRRAAGDAAAASGMGHLGFRLARAVFEGESDPRHSAELVVDSLLSVLGLVSSELQRAAARQFVVFGIDVDRGAVRMPQPEGE